MRAVRAMFLVGLMAAAAAAQTGPKADPAKADPPRPPADLPSDLSAERARLQGQLLELVNQLKARPPGGVAAPKVPPGPKLDLPAGGSAGNLLRAATSFFKADDFDAALGALRQLRPDDLPREDRALAQYLTGCCLRRLNRRGEAKTFFRDVAEGKDDPFLARCAVSQLALINSTQELEGLLAQFRARPKSP